MKTFFFSVVMLMLVFTLACTSEEVSVESENPYISLSRFTDPKDFSFMLDKLPNDVIGICEVAKGQIVHYNILCHYNVPLDKNEKMIRVWPPRMSDTLKALKDTKPYNLYDPREIEQRIASACVPESYFLAGLLRYRKIPVRVRAGYFKDIRGNGDFVVKFWEENARYKGIEAELLKEDPEKWKEQINAETRRQNEVNHYIEHWICEYRDETGKKWRLLDANNTFLKVTSDIDVGFHLPKKHYEYAFEAWKKMRSSDNFNPDQYREEPLDGRSHIRSQLLMDFYNLLNYDSAGLGEPTRDSYNFIRGKRYEDVSAEELEELDMLANLMAQEPTKDELVAFYRKSKTLRLEAAEKDPYSFVFSK